MALLIYGGTPREKKKIRLLMCFPKLFSYKLLRLQTFPSKLFLCKLLRTPEVTYEFLFMSEVSMVVVVEAFLVFHVSVPVLVSCPASSALPLPLPFPCSLPNPLNL